MAEEKRGVAEKRIVFQTSREHVEIQSAKFAHLSAIFGKGVSPRCIK
jgi:hypothetical protein